MDDGTVGQKILAGIRRDAFRYQQSNDQALAYLRDHAAVVEFIVKDPAAGRECIDSGLYDSIVQLACVVVSNELWASEMNESLLPHVRDDPAEQSPENNA